MLHNGTGGGRCRGHTQASTPTPPTPSPLTLPPLPLPLASAGSGIPINHFSSLINFTIKILLALNCRPPIASRHSTPALPPACCCVAPSFLRIAPPQRCCRLVLASSRHCIKRCCRLIVSSCPLLPPAWHSTQRSLGSLTSLTSWRLKSQVSCSPPVLMPACCSVAPLLHCIAPPQHCRRLIFALPCLHVTTLRPNVAAGLSLQRCIERCRRLIAPKCPALPIALLRPSIAAGLLSHCHIKCCRRLVASSCLFALRRSAPALPPACCHAIASSVAAGS